MRSLKQATTEMRRAGAVAGRSWRSGWGPQPLDFRGPAYTKLRHYSALYQQAAMRQSAAWWRQLARNHVSGEYVSIEGKLSA